MKVSRHPRGGESMLRRFFPYFGGVGVDLEVALDVTRTMRLLRDD